MSAWHRVCLQVCVLPEAVVSPLGIEPCQWAAASKPGNNRNRAHLLLHSGFFLSFFILFGSFFPCLPLPLDILNSPVNSSLPGAYSFCRTLTSGPSHSERQGTTALLGFWKSCCGHPAVGQALAQSSNQQIPGCKCLTRARLCAEVGGGGGGG